jgi:adenylate kinase family enzyme
LRRVAIFGNTGGGKSTLAKKLSHFTGLPLHHLDLIHYDFNGIQVPAEKYHEAHTKILKQDEWIIEGYGD